MLDGIEVNIVDVACQIFVAADGMFPVAALPNSLLALSDFTRRSFSIGRKPARKFALDEAPPERKVGFVRGQRLDRVEMVRQHADREGLEWIELLR